MKTASYTDFRNNLKSYMDSVTEDSETVIINRDNSNGAVLISLDEYNSLVETEYIMSSPEMTERIKTARQEIKDGNCTVQKGGESVSEFLDRVVCTE